MPPLGSGSLSLYKNSDISFLLTGLGRRCWIFHLRDMQSLGPLHLLWSLALTREGGQHWAQQCESGGWGRAAPPTSGGGDTRVQGHLLSGNPHVLRMWLMRPQKKMQTLGIGV